MLNEGNPILEEPVGTWYPSCEVLLEHATVVVPLVLSVNLVFGSCFLYEGSTLPPSTPMLCAYVQFLFK